MTDKYLEVDGEPVPCEDLMEWARATKMADRIVAKTKMEDCEVSTVFLGLDHGFGGPVPILYETMVFGGENDQWMDRYATRAEAAAGHAHVVGLLREGKPLPE